MIQYFQFLIENSSFQKLFLGKFFLNPRSKIQSTQSGQFQSLIKSIRFLLIIIIQINSYQFIIRIFIYSQFQSFIQYQCIIIVRKRIMVMENGVSCKCIICSFIYDLIQTERMIIISELQLELNINASWDLRKSKNFQSLLSDQLYDHHLREEMRPFQND
ncbi:hypothetical protein pb186bvf_014007 [Paramecium bursaria]